METWSLCFYIRAKSAKAFSVLLVISMVVPYLGFYWSDITEYIKNKFTKSEGES